MISKLQFPQISKCTRPAVTVTVISIIAIATILSSAAPAVEALVNLAISPSLRRQGLSTLRRASPFILGCRLPSVPSFSLKTPLAFVHHQSAFRSSANNIPPSLFSNRASRKTTSSLFNTMSSSSETEHMTFPTFLASVPNTAIQRLEADATSSQSPSIQMIMGNEAGDADSIISALGLAHVNSLISPTSDQTSVPIVSIPRADMSLRRDAVLLLDLAGIDVNKLLFIDDEIVTAKLLTSEPSSQNDSKSLTLVDHNRIRSSLVHLAPMVTEIVDHHEDENSHENVTISSGKRIIAFDNGHATVASTCTLVTERLLQAMDATEKIDGGLGLALLGVILLDSVNMLPEAGKGTARDEEVINALLKRTDWSSCANVSPSLVDANTMERLFPNGRHNAPDRTSLFEVLSNSKFDPKFWADMTVNDCLRIDYKKFMVAGQSLVSSIGLSSVLLSMDAFLSKQNFQEELSAYITAENVGLFGVLTLQFEDGKNPRRELLLTGSDSKILESFVDHLMKHPDAAFLDVVERKDCFATGDEKNDTGELPIRVFTQGNSKGSRKQVAPVLLAHALTISKL